MLQDKGHLWISDSDEDEIDKIFDFIDRAGCKLQDYEKDLEKLTQEYVNNSKRPLLVLMLGNSILNQNHFDQIQNVLKDKRFDSLDLLLQIVAGDGTVAYEIVNLIRSKVAGELVCIAPGLLSGPGTLIAIGSDSVLGLNDTALAALDVPHTHPGLLHWAIKKKERLPEFQNNYEEYKRSYPNNIEFAKKVLTSPDSEKLINHLTYRPDTKVYDFLLPKLVEIGLKGSIPTGEDLIRLRVLQGYVRGALGNFIYLVQ